MHHETEIERAEHTRKMAVALDKGGIFSDDEHLTYNIWDAANEAYAVMIEGATSHDFFEFRKKLKDSEGVSVAYYQRLAAVCRGALQSPEIPDDLVKSVVFALAVFEDRAGEGRKNGNLRNRHAY